MINRKFSARLFPLLKAFPIVSVLGPRQCGKTTFIRHELPNWKYIDLEKPFDRAPFEADPWARLEQLKSKIILDEAQQMPGLFTLLRSFIDENRKKNGQLILLGSASPHLIQGISESLAGRTAFLELTPFLFSEIEGYERSVLNRIWFRGAFPDPFLFDSSTVLSDWFDAYVRTFIERDLNSMGINISPVQMRRLWMMLAHAHGTIWNASKIAGSMGINYQTVNRYVEILELAFLVRRLPPFYTNIKKRLVKSPKIYIRDSGILHYFLGITQPKYLDVHPGRGNSWEGFMIEQIINACNLTSKPARFYYWRTSGGAEVDLLIESGNRIIPFEIKLHSSPALGHVKGLKSCMHDLKITKGYVIYPGSESYSLGSGITAIPAKQILMNPATLL